MSDSDTDLNIDSTLKNLLHGFNVEYKLMMVHAMQRQQPKQNLTFNLDVRLCASCIIAVIKTDCNDFSLKENIILDFNTYWCTTYHLKDNTLSHYPH